MGLAPEERYVSRTPPFSVSHRLIQGCERQAEDVRGVQMVRGEKRYSTVFLGKKAFGGGLWGSNELTEMPTLSI